MSILRFLGVIAETTGLKRGPANAVARNRKLKVEALEARAMLALLNPLVLLPPSLPSVEDLAEELVPLGEPIVLDPGPITIPPLGPIVDLPPITVFDPSPPLPGGDGEYPLEGNGSEGGGAGDPSQGSEGGWGGDSGGGSGGGYGGGSEGGTGGGSESGAGSGSETGSGGGEGSSGSGSGAGSESGAGTGSGSGSGSGAGSISSFSSVHDYGVVRLIGTATDDESLAGLTVYLTTTAGHQFTATINADGTWASASYVLEPGTTVMAYFIDADGNHSEMASILV